MNQAEIIWTLLIVVAPYESIKAFSETDQIEDLKKFDVRPWFCMAKTIRSFP